VAEILKEMSAKYQKCRSAAVADLLFGRSERLLIEQLQHNLLFQWSVEMGMVKTV
jgi:hypothetical protein